MQISIYNRKHWHALSHSLHFVRHEGRLATIGSTRLTRFMAANELGFLYTRCGTCSSSYRDVFRMASPMVISTGPPACAQDDGGTQAKVLCFSYFSHLVWSVFVSSDLRGCWSSTKFYEVSVRILFGSCDSQSINIVCPVSSIEVGSIASLCSNYVRSAQSKIVQPLGFCLGQCNCEIFSLLIIFTFHACGAVSMRFFHFYL